MKRILFILVVALGLGITSCNQPDEAKVESNLNENIAQQSTEKSDPNDVKPMHLTTQGFKDVIWNYQDNPETWVFKGELPVVVDFYADWCKPCKMIAPIMDDLADHYKGRVNFYKINTDQNKEVSTLFQIRSIPAILFVPKEGQPSMQAGAMTKEDYIKIIDDYVLKIK